MTPAPRKGAYGTALVMLAARDRTRSELSRMLASRGYGSGEVRAALESLAERGYLDDRRLAAAWARNRLEMKPMGARRLGRELEARGVEQPLVQEVLKEVYEDGEEAAARRAMAANASRFGRHPAGLRPGRLARFLARRGFSTELIWRLLREEPRPHRGDE